MDNLKLGLKKTNKKITEKINAVKHLLEIKNKLDAVQENRRLAQELQDYDF